MKPNFWTPGRDEALKRHKAAGLSSSKIAALLGTTRNAVIGRSSRLRGKIFRSQVERLNQAKFVSAKAYKARRTREAEIIAALRADLDAGVARTAAIERARQAGATFRAIGKCLGVSRQRIHQIAA